MNDQDRRAFDKLLDKLIDLDSTNDLNASDRAQYERFCDQYNDEKTQRYRALGLSAFLNNGDENQ